MQLFGLRKTPGLSHAPRQALAAYEHERAQIQRRAVGENRPFAHSGRFCGHKERETRRCEFLTRFVAISTEADELKSFLARLHARLSARPSGELARMLEWTEGRLLRLEGELTPDGITSVLRERELFPDVDHLSPPEADED
jgi:hypothetical protein